MKTKAVELIHDSTERAGYLENIERKPKHGPEIQKKYIYDAGILDCCLHMVILVLVLKKSDVTL